MSQASASLWWQNHTECLCKAQDKQFVWSIFQKLLYPFSQLFLFPVGLPLKKYIKPTYTEPNGSWTQRGPPKIDGLKKFWHRVEWKSYPFCPERESLWFMWGIKKLLFKELSTFFHLQIVDWDLDLALDAGERRGAWSCCSWENKLELFDAYNLCTHVKVSLLRYLPMKAPVLHMRLKKQLSGGRVPHLLQ